MKSKKNGLKKFSPERLRQLRKTNNLTQNELGEKIGQFGAAVSHYETGIKTPSLSTSIKLANALNSSLEDLLDLPE